MEPVCFDGSQASAVAVGLALALRGALLAIDHYGKNIPLLVALADHIGTVLGGKAQRFVGK